MKTILCWLLIFLPIHLLAGDTTAAKMKHPPVLKGYKRWLYKIVTLHPKLNSGLERDLLKHYLLGTGTTYQLSETDALHLKEICSTYLKGEVITPVNTEAHASYRIQLIDLNANAYFGWGLGTVCGIFHPVTGQLESIADVYDFPKAKKGQRSFMNECYTRLFKLIAPSTARPFLVTFHAEGYIAKP